jgi:hypothetical protein
MSQEPLYSVPAVVQNHGLREIGDKGTPAFTVTFQTQDETPRILYADLWLTDAAFERSLKVLREVFGWRGSNMEELNTPIFADQVLSLSCRQVQYQTGAGDWKQKEEVAFINKPGGLKKMDAAESGAALGKLNAKLRALGGAPKSTTPPGRTGAAPSRPSGGKPQQTPPDESY